MRSRWKALILAMMVGTAAGCYQSPDIHYYEPGEYKGSDDPLLEKTPRPIAAGTACGAVSGADGSVITYTAAERHA